MAQLGQTPATLRTADDSFNGVDRLAMSYEDQPRWHRTMMAAVTTDVSGSLPVLPDMPTEAASGLHPLKSFPNALASARPGPSGLDRGDAV